MVTVCYCCHSSYADGLLGLMVWLLCRRGCVGGGGGVAMQTVVSVVMVWLLCRRGCFGGSSQGWGEVVLGRVEVVVRG